MATEMRIKRLEQLILETVAPLISQGLSDPRLQFVTVTRVRLSRDLSICRVNWSSLGNEADRSKATHALEHAKSAVQKAIASLNTRTLPRVHFHYDESGAKAQRVNEILHQIRMERGEDVEQEEDEDGEAEKEKIEGDEEE